MSDPSVLCELTENAKETIERECGRHGYILEYRSVFAFIVTPVGVWRIRLFDNGLCGLKHHNYLRGAEAAGDKNIYDPKKYHFQKDKQEFPNIEAIFCYIKRHDDSKKIEEKSIKDMPTATRKQRKWRRDAERRKHRKDLANVYRLFETI